MQGTIVQTMDDHQDSLLVTFPDVISNYDCRISRWSFEVAPFETKSKELHEWRANELANNEGLVCIAHDNIKWYKSTILEYKSIKQMEKQVLMCKVAFRVYGNTPNCDKQDDIGHYEGWGKCFDEWVPVFSPRIVPAGTNVSEKTEFADDLDDLFVSQEEGE